MVSQFKVGNHKTGFDRIDDMIPSSYFCSKRLPLSVMADSNVVSPDRWNILSNLASDHKNCHPSILDITHKIELIDPETLRYGVTPDVASKILELRIDSNSIENGCGWPHFLDVISILFINLRNLYISSSMNELEDDIILWERNRMLRLYILYRLPDLVVITDEYVTEGERNLARPSCVNGVKVRKNDWCTKSMLPIKVEEEENEDFSKEENGMEVMLSQDEGKESIKIVNQLFYDEILHDNVKATTDHDPNQSSKNYSKHINLRKAKIPFRKYNIAFKNDIHSNFIQSSEVFRRPPKYPHLATLAKKFPCEKKNMKLPIKKKKKFSVSSCMIDRLDLSSSSSED